MRWELPIYPCVDRICVERDIPSGRLVESILLSSDDLTCHYDECPNDASERVLKWVVRGGWHATDI
jgi:hypothetical protein